MGAWGAGVFDNDDASDWVWELEDDSDGQVLIEALSEIVDTPVDEQPEAPECSNALAAAEVVASARAAVSTSHLPTEASVWIQANRTLVTPALVALASGAVERIAIDSELKDLWDEAGDDTWAGIVADLQSRLRP